ncbi:hypothetical protein [Methylococcus capsulatus]|uniref:hypothetical protein n=2 Tax=Methylococcus capsulatus TaxID=414 RepID=UPI001C533EAC|nr:hypothetical protein [Methylococcus capsulatus]QXP88018.1 hypothetical protein KW112_02400 [Methylococcus capsulatus]QXP94970.1 hypothetical protein KW113_07380 [Methylococcus capsulatus]
MKQPMSYLRLAVPALCLLSLAVPPAEAKKADDKYNRYITFQNDFPFTVYPVIQVPADICDGAAATGDRRIIINYDAKTEGLPAGKKITVWIPRDQKQVNVGGKTVDKNCWYQSGRVYIFPVALKTYEANIVKLDPLQTKVITKFDDPTHPSEVVDCYKGDNTVEGEAVKGNCMTGVSGASYSVDAPAQLAEFTFDADNPTDQNMDTGDPMADIDVSMVDELYIPVAGSVANHGATGYMGGSAATVNANGVNDLAQFKKRIDGFLTDPDGRGGRKNVWPVFAAYTSQYFNSPNKEINTFSDLLPKELGKNAGNTIIPHFPGGYNSIDMTLTRGPSTNYYTGTNYVTDKGALITGVRYDEKMKKPGNPLVQPYIDRWTYWVKQKDNPGFCADKNNLEQLKWPDHVCRYDSKKAVQDCTFRHQYFCEKFQESVKVVWDHFTNDPVDGFNPNQAKVWEKCGFPKAPYPTDENTKNFCIIQQIVGYDSKVLGGDLPGRVQALLRGVAFEANDPYDPNHPSVPKADVQQWQFDPFLTFAAPYDSQFNLNPYTRLVHDSGKDGLGSVSYSFSIDDKYGNFRDAASGFTVDAGGVTALENKRPYDPYQQYTVTWGYNRDQFSLAWLNTGTSIEAIRAKLEQVAESHGKRPFLLREGDKLAVLGHDANGTWQLTNPLTTKTDLEALAAQEKENSKGKNHTYQDLIDRVFLKKPADVFPAQALNVDAVSEQAIGVLNFDVDTGWSAGEARLYDQIALKKADVPQANNWVSLTTCGHQVPVRGPGAQTLPLVYDTAKGYLPCEIVAKDKFGDELKLSMAPEKKTGIIDIYTGSKVTDWTTLWGFPTGKKHTGAPPVTSDLNAKDLQYCIDNSSPYFSVSGFCNNVNVSAVWAGAPLARDVVYMGLDYVNMPRVGVSIAQPPKNGPDPDAVFWPNGAKVTGELMPDGVTVHVTWPKAIITSGKPLNYSLTFGGQFQASCNTQHNPDINPNTYCDAKITKGDKTPKKMDVVAINYTGKPVTQSVLLSGTFTSGVRP